MDLSISVAFIALLTIVNPIGNIPVFLALTCDQSPNEQRHTALAASMAVMVILLVSLFSGETILGIFGISLDAFRLAGMAVIASLAWSMLNAKMSPIQHTSEEKRDAELKQSVTVVPLAIPILAGAGSISLVVGYAAEVSSPLDMAKGAVIILLISLTTAMVLLTAPNVQKILGISGMNILTRIFGLLLLAIAVNGAAAALVDLFPALGS